MNQPKRDIHSQSNPEQVRTRNVALDLTVDFDKSQLRGHATLTVERQPGANGAPLVVDTRGLAIDKVEATGDPEQFSAAKFSLGKADPILGAALTVELPPAATRVRIHYATTAESTALQWLAPAQTAGKKHPFLFTQSQPILARTWIPLQDSPGVRVTFSAVVRTPKALRAVMSTANQQDAPLTGEFRFHQRRAIPAYLIALAVGDVEFRGIGPRTGVYAEPSVVESAQREFSDVEKMLRATEALYGPYRWDRYDVLVLPPSFPFGGMENPMLTFATPTILAGDKSLVSLIAHELAHSWSGNLVTNATWRDFWLNEGFTVYVERRILEQVYGKPRADMEAVLGRAKLEADLKRLAPKDQILHINLDGRDPDDGFNDIPYEKGALFLSTIEQAVGRAKFDEFLRKYFDHFGFTSITTGIFEDYLARHLPEASKVPLKAWIEEPGVPAGAFVPKSEAFPKVEAEAAKPAAAVAAENWSTHEWLHFIESLPPKPDMAGLDKRFHLTQSGNAEIASAWLILAVRNGYAPANARVEEFLTSMGRRKFLKPLYEELVKTPEGTARARTIFAKARAGYHPIAVSTIEGIVK